MRLKAGNWVIRMLRQLKPILWLGLLCTVVLTAAQASRLQTQRLTTASLPALEYLWYEAENMRGISADARHEPLLNPSWMQLPAAKKPGWGINGPGVSAEWSQGGESEWNSVNASADETRGTISQDIEVPRAGEYKLWVRYADWANKTESFTIKITQSGRDVFSHEFGAKDV